LSNNIIVEDSNLGLYLRDIARFKPLSSQEELKIAKLIKKGNRNALDRLIKANLRFVVSVARNYQNQGSSLVDLINDGNIGLIKAAQRFDENKNFKFISYAVWWVRQSILQGLADQSRIVKIPLNRVARIHKLGKTQLNLEQKFHRFPNVKEVADEMGLSERDVNEIMKIGAKHTSLNASLSEDESNSLLDIIYNKQSEMPDEKIAQKSEKRVIKKMLNNLTDREKRVISLYFGLGEESRYTLDEIGQSSGVTRERIRQIKNVALQKLRSIKSVNLNN
jgi:RNA polymerase primary sigma factor